MSKSRLVLPGGMIASAGAVCLLAVGAGARRAAHRHHQRPGPADADRDPGVCRRRRRRGAGRQRHRRRRLRRSRTFGAVSAARPAQLYPERLGDDSGATPQFADWRQINAQALVTGTVQTQADGRLGVQFRLWDVFAEQQLTGFAYTTTRQNWRRIAHIIADEIYKRITGEEGYFDTRIVYVAESGPAQTGSSAWRSWIRTAPTTTT